MTAIEWTDETWNPIVGCSIVSPGCTNCYAMAMAARLEKIGVPHYAGTTKPSKAGAVWTGKIARAPNSILLKPLNWKKPRRIFVNSMSDLFHESIPDEWIDRVFAVMALCPQHQFQVLTKRSERMHEYCSQARKRVWDQVSMIEADWTDGKIAVRLPCIDGDAKIVALARHGAKWGGEEPWPLFNVWLGVSAERQEEADERIPLLLQTPAAVRFVSLEPLLAPIDLARINGDPRWQPSLYNSLTGERRLVERGGSVPVASKMDFPRINWVICGGESGPRARPMHPDWARSLRDQCKAAGVPFFFKQWGEWRPHKIVPGGNLGADVRSGKVRVVHPSGRSDIEIFEATGGRNTEPGTRYMICLSKKRAGRLLDGVEHSEWPATA